MKGNTVLTPVEFASWLERYVASVPPSASSPDLLAACGEMIAAVGKGAAQLAPHGAANASTFSATALAFATWLRQYASSPGFEARSAARWCELLLSCVVTEIESPPLCNPCALKGSPLRLIKESES